MIAANLTQAQWQPDVRLTNDTALSVTSTGGMGWCIASNGVVVNVVWCDKRDGNFEIYYKRSADGGVTWGNDQRLTNDPSLSYHPCIAVSGNIVHIVWEDTRDGNYEIYYKQSQDEGISWSADSRLTNSVNSYEPSMVVSGSVVHVIYSLYNNGIYQIYYKHSTNGGITWEADIQLTNSVQSYNPSIASSGDTVHVVWNDNRDGNYEIYYKRSTDGGITWGADTRLTVAFLTSNMPSIAASGSKVHIVWEDFRDGEGTGKIYYKRSTDGGTSWEADTRLTVDTGNSMDPNLALSGSIVHVVWQDNRDGNYKIYYKRSENEGISWGSDTLLTVDAVNGEYPSTAVSGPLVHVVWTDSRDGNEEIYYKRDTTGGFPLGTGNDLTGNTGQQISIWPNPAFNIIHVSFNNDTKEKTLLSIWNILGVEILSKQIQNGEAVIDVSNLQNGLYFIEIKPDNRQMVGKKLIILN